MAINPSKTFTYILGELKGELFVVDLREADNKIKQQMSFVTKAHVNTIGAAAIRMHHNGEFLYASNYGTETITNFKIDKIPNQLTVLDYQSTYGKIPHDFNVDPSRKQFIAANQHSNTLGVFEINLKVESLHLKSKIKVKTPVNIS